MRQTISRDDRARPGELLLGIPALAQRQQDFGAPQQEVGAPVRSGEHLLDGEQRQRLPRPSGPQEQHGAVEPAQDEL